MIVNKHSILLAGVAVVFALAQLNVASADNSPSTVAASLPVPSPQSVATGSQESQAPKSSGPAENKTTITTITQDHDHASPISSTSSATTTKPSNGTSKNDASSTSSSSSSPQPTPPAVPGAKAAAKGAADAGSSVLLAVVIVVAVVVVGAIIGFVVFRYKSRGGL